MKYIYVFIIFAVIGCVVYVTLSFLGYRYQIAGVSIYSLWAIVELPTWGTYGPEDWRGFMMFISSSFMVGMLLVFVFSERASVGDIEKCIQELGFTPAQCERIVYYQGGEAEDCSSFFALSSEQCTFLLTRESGIEECRRLFDYTDEQCAFFTRIKTRPIM